jgi:hypothetical protein
MMESFRFKIYRFSNRAPGFGKGVRESIRHCRKLRPVWKSDHGTFFSTHRPFKPANGSSPFDRLKIRVKPEATFLKGEKREKRNSPLFKNKRGSRWAPGDKTRSWKVGLIPGVNRFLEKHEA